MSFFDRLSYRTWTLYAAAMASVPSALAIKEPDPIEGISNDTDLSAVAISIITMILDILALIAVIFIIIAGIRLIISQGEEEAKDKAKKTIMYVVVGLIVVLLARVIVGFVVSQGNNL